MKNHDDRIRENEDAFRELAAGADAAEALRGQYDGIENPSTVLHQYGAWFVTDYGVEAIDEGGLAYHVSAAGLWDHADESGWSWECQVTSKVWVNAADACRAFAKARQVHIVHKPAKIQA